MRTFEGSKGTTIQYNPDGSGEVVISGDEYGHGQTQYIHVPCEDLLEFVAELIRGQEISHLEQMDWREVISLQTRTTKVL